MKIMQSDFIFLVSPEVTRLCSSHSYTVLKTAPDLLFNPSYLEPNHAINVEHRYPFQIEDR